MTIPYRHRARTGPSDGTGTGGGGRSTTRGHGTHPARARRSTAPTSAFRGCDTSAVPTACEP
ncbi:hypothetical protein [Streptomyces longispororuber]|uniref:hypothetical protein n=1 Tax=Streptomyces longispororuber TaxID=68230 RepID=UPI0036FAEA0F